MALARHSQVSSIVEAVEKPPSEHIFAQSIGRNYVQDRNRNAEQNAPEPAWQAFAHIVEICRHDISFIALYRFWWVGARGWEPKEGVFL